MCYNTQVLVALYYLSGVMLLTFWLTQSRSFLLVMKKKTPSFLARATIFIYEEPAPPPPPPPPLQIINIHRMLPKISSMK